MNSYPPELLVQLAPVMFVAGLGPHSAPQPVPQSPSPKDAFTVLAVRLKEALLAQRKVAVWAPDKSKTFQVVLVDPVSLRWAWSLNRSARAMLCTLHHDIAL